MSSKTNISKLLDFMEVLTCVLQCS